MTTDLERGSLAILSDTKKATAVVISPADKQQIVSAEALCLIQLAGGMDLGTGILPPDALSRIAGVPGGVSPLRLRAMTNVDWGGTSEDDDTTGDKQPENEERRNGIYTNAPKIHEAVKKLPGLTRVSLEDVIEALQLCADDKGGVNDRDTFTSLLDELRTIAARVPPSHVNFVLTVNVISENGISERQVDGLSVLEALGLSLRYGIAVEVEEGVLESEEGFDVAEVDERYPNFRPMKELRMDAKIMDGFIPSMFQQATKDREDEE